MASEITTSLRLRYSKNGINDSRTMSDTITASGDDTIGGVQSIGFAAHEAIGMGEVTTAGWCRVLNMDATNFVQLGTDVSAAFVPFIKLKAGESVVFRLATNAPYAKADTGAVRIEYMIFED